jgi:hypothetical protein
MVVGIEGVHPGRHRRVTGNTDLLDGHRAGHRNGQPPHHGARGQHRVVPLDTDIRPVTEVVASEHGQQGVDVRQATPAVAGRPPAGARPPSQASDGLGVRAKVVRSTATRPKVGPH